MKKSWVIAVVSLVIVSVIVFGVRFRRQSAKIKQVDVVEGPIVEAIYGIGKVEAVRRFQAKAGVPSGIMRLPIREGDLVKTGDVLVAFAEGTAIRAPFPGMITRLNYKVGESVFAGNVIAELIDPTDFDLRVVLDQRAAMRVRTGQVARLSFDGLRTEEFLATVRAVYSSESQFTVLLKPKILPKNVLEGMTADVSIEVAKKEKGILVPVASLHEKRIARIRDGKTSSIEVEAGLVNNELVEIVSGDLRKGDKVEVKVK
jgi:macrolide-specific efflux system membrane fusion protein